MKITGSICSLIIILFYTAGYFLVFQMQQNETRAYMKQLIRSGRFSEQYETFHFSKNEFAKQKVNESELIVEKKIYDIVRIIEEASTVTVICIHDEKEEALLGYLQMAVNANSSNEHSPAASLLQFLDTVFIISPDIHQYKSEEDSFLVPYCLTIYQAPAAAMGNPPPEYICQS